MNDAVMIKYSASMDQGKFGSAPNDTKAPNDIRWLARRYTTTKNP